MLPSVPKKPGCLVAPALRVRIERVAAVAVVEAVVDSLAAVGVAARSRLGVARRLLRRERVVEVADRVRRVGHVEDEVREVGHLRVGQLGRAADEAGEGDVERLERVHLVEDAGVRLRRHDRVAAAVGERRPSCWTAPLRSPRQCIGAVVVQAAEALRRHRPLERLVGREAGSRSPAAGEHVEHGRRNREQHVVGRGARDRQRRARRVAEVPRQAVEVAADVAAGARLIAVGRGERRVVEERAARRDVRRLGVEHGEVVGLRAGSTGRPSRCRCRSG